MALAKCRDLLCRRDGEDQRLADGTRAGLADAIGTTSGSHNDDKGQTMSRDVEVETESNLYERDFYSWTQRQADLLRSGRLQALDIAHLVEEIETLGRSERASLKSAYRLICSHLLKMKYQTAKFTRSWYNTVDWERGEVVEILDENPSLRPSREDAFAKAYALARKDAARETRMPLATFPEEPPFTLADCESTAFMQKELRDHLAAQDAAAGRAGKRKSKAD